MIIANVDYALLKKDDEVFDAFARIIKETLAASAGIGVDSVMSVFSAGSVRVDSELVLPPGSSVDAKRAKLLEDETFLAGRLSSELLAVPGIDNATTGTIGVHFVQQVAKRPTSAAATNATATTTKRPTKGTPPTQLLGVLIVGAICLPLILVVCLVACCCCDRMPKSGSELDLLQTETPGGKERAESNIVQEETTALDRNSDADSNGTGDMSREPDVWRMGRILHYSKLDEQHVPYEVLLDGQGSPARCLQLGLDPAHAQHQMAIDVRSP